MTKTMTLMIIMIPMMMNIILILTLMIPSKIFKMPPMLMMMILIMMTLMITYKMNFMFYSWISFMMFLIMIGGLMIIYMYITSLSYNELYIINMNYMYLNFLKIMPILLIYLFINLLNNEINLFYLNNYDSWIINTNYIQPMYNSFYKENNNKATYFIMIYLYYSMICIMNICYKYKLPLRQMMY